MLLKSYSKEIFRPECNPSFESVHCIANLDQDISAVLPYLNTVLGGFGYLKDPPAWCSPPAWPRASTARRIGPPLGAENKQRLEEYMHQFKFDV